MARRRLVKRSWKRRAGVVLIACILLVGVGYIDLDTRLRPMVQNYAVQVARRDAMVAVHQGVEQVLAESPLGYYDLITVTRGAEEQILSAEANVFAINLLKSQVSQQVAERLAQQDEHAINVPLGNLIGGSFFTGRGPFLPLTVHTGGSVVTSLRDSFTDAGINQTCHAIYLTMTVMITVQLPMERQSFELDTEFLVCETVLIGKVPESYTNMYLEGSHDAEEIFDIMN